MKTDDRCGCRANSHTDFWCYPNLADFFYKCDEYYSPSDERAVRWNDPALGIAWGVDAPILSARDVAAPLLAEMARMPGL